MLSKAKSLVVEMYGPLSLTQRVWRSIRIALVVLSALVCVAHLLLPATVFAAVGMKVVLGIAFLILLLFAFEILLLMY